MASLVCFTVAINKNKGSGLGYMGSNATTMAEDAAMQVEHERELEEKVKMV